MATSGCRIRVYAGRLACGRVYCRTPTPRSFHQAARTDVSTTSNTSARSFATTTALLFGGLGIYYSTLSHNEPLRLDSKPGFPDTSSTKPLRDTDAPVHNVSVVNLKAARAEMVAIVGEENVITRLDEIERHTSSEWSSHPADPNEAPAAVVYPASTEQTSKIMQICHKRRIPVVGFSGGTSLEGHFANTRRGISIDFSKMSQILAIHKDDLDVVVQPGVGYEELNEKLAEVDLFFPPDPGPGAQIGGMTGTGCSGTNAYRYGTMKNWVISLTIVLADGTVVKTRRRPTKSSAGYDLTRLFTGAEGTLGLVTEAVLKVTPKPQNVRVAVASFPTVSAATRCVSQIVQSGIQVAAVELLDEVAMKVVNDSGATEREWDEAPTLFFKFSGTEHGVQEEIATVEQLSKANGNNSFIFATDDQESDDLWTARHTIAWAGQSLKKNESDKMWGTDCAVPVSRLSDMIEQTKADLDACGLVHVIVGHVGDGNFHSGIFYSDAERQTAEDVVHRMVERAIEMDGTVTGEHGVGLVKRDYLPHELGQNTVDAMRKIKSALDPLCILNCDKVIRMEPPRS